jgi:hypothetical protein
MHHRRRSLNATLLGVLAVALVLTAGACSKDHDEGFGSGVPISTTTTGGAGPGGTPSPGGTGGDGGSTTTRPGAAGGGAETTDGDPSAGIPQDQFCRGYAEVKGSTQAMADAIAAQQLDDLKTAYNRLSDAYLAMAETPPDVVYDQLRAVAMRYDDLGTDVNDATTIDQVKAIAVRAQTGGLADDLKAVRNYGTEHC